MPTLAAQVALQVVIMTMQIVILTNCSTASDDKVVIIIV